MHEGYVFHQEQDIVLVKQAMLKASGRRVLLVDHGKLGRTALHRLAPVTGFDLVVTDDAGDPAVVEALRDRACRSTSRRAETAEGHLHTALVV